MKAVFFVDLNLQFSS